MYFLYKVFCNVMTCVNRQEYVSILISAWLCAMNQGGNTDIVYSSLAVFLSGAFLMVGLVKSDLQIITEVLYK